MSTLLDLATVEKKSALCGVTWRKRRTMAAAREFFSLRTASVSKPQKCTMSVLGNSFPVVGELLSFLSFGDYSVHKLTLWLICQKRRTMATGREIRFASNLHNVSFIEFVYGCWGILKIQVLKKTIIKSILA